MARKVSRGRSDLNDEEAPQSPITATFFPDVGPVTAVEGWSRRRKATDQPTGRSRCPPATAGRKAAARRKVTGRGPVPRPPRRLTSWLRSWQSNDRGSILDPTDPVWLASLQRATTSTPIEARVKHDHFTDGVVEADVEN